jgi:hypothetical protein
MHFWCVFVPSIRSAPQEIAWLADDRAGSAGLTMSQRDDAFCIDLAQRCVFARDLHQFKTKPRIAPPAVRVR